MPFTLTEEEQLVQSTVRSWAQGRLGLDKAADRDRHARFPEDALREAADLGLLAMGLGEEEGGAGVGPTTFALAVDEIAQVDPDTAILLAAHTMGLRCLRGTPLARPALEAAARGEMVAHAWAEEAHGSDVAKFGTNATPRDGGWALTGQKAWVMGGGEAAFHLVLAQAPKGPLMAWVPRGAAGLSLGRAEPIMGLRSCGVRTVYLDSVPVAAGNVVAPPGQGLDVASKARPWLQLGAAAALVGCMAGAAEAAYRFAESRVQFGQPVATYQAVSDAAVDVDVHVQAARSLVLQAAARLEDGDAALWAARAKSFAATTAVAMTRRAIRIQGGTGFMREGGTERFARCARVLQFVGEPPHIQGDTIRRAILDAPFGPSP